MPEDETAEPVGGVMRIRAQVCRSKLLRGAGGRHVNLHIDDLAQRPAAAHHPRPLAVPLGTASAAFLSGAFSEARRKPHWRLPRAVSGAKKNLRRSAQRAGRCKERRSRDLHGGLQPAQVG
jgi:hypothetical protein